MKFGVKITINKKEKIIKYLQILKINYKILLYKQNI